jgi:hypothetical protein
LRIYFSRPQTYSLPTFYNFYFFVDIEVLKRKKQKIEMKIVEDEKSKDIIAAQIISLQEKREEIDERIAKRKLTYSKISDTLEQSDLGLTKIIDSMQVILSFAASKTEHTDIEHSD